MLPESWYMKRWDSDIRVPDKPAPLCLLHRTNTNRNLIIFFFVVLNIYIYIYLSNTLLGDDVDVRFLDSGSMS